MMKEVILGDGEAVRIIWEKENGTRELFGIFTLVEQGGRPPRWEFVLDNPWEAAVKV